MQKITPHLWFDNQAKEAAAFYVSAFGNGSKINNINTLHNTPSGDVDTVTFELLGYSFIAISAGPLFTFNPSISFFVNFDPSRDDRASEKLDTLWEKLSDGGTALMPLREGERFAAMDSAQDHAFQFNEAISLMVNCDTQEEIDDYWEKLSAVPEAEQCGWLKDKYGVSWQIVPCEMDKMMSEGTREQVDRVTQTFLPMKKLIITELQEAYEGQ